MPPFLAALLLCGSLACLAPTAAARETDSADIPILVVGPEFDLENLSPECILIICVSCNAHGEVYAQERRAAVRYNGLLYVRESDPPTPGGHLTYSITVVRTTACPYEGNIEFDVGADEFLAQAARFRRRDRGQDLAIAAAEALAPSLDSDPASDDSSPAPHPHYAAEPASYELPADAAFFPAFAVVCPDNAELTPDTSHWLPDDVPIQRWLKRPDWCDLVSRAERIPSWPSLPIQPVTACRLLPLTRLELVHQTIRFETEWGTPGSNLTLEFTTQYQNRGGRWIDSDIQIQTDPLGCAQVPLWQDGQWMPTGRSTPLPVDPYALEGRRTYLYPDCFEFQSWTAAPVTLQCHSLRPPPALPVQIRVEDVDGHCLSGDDLTRLADRADFQLLIFDDRNNCVIRQVGGPACRNFFLPALTPGQYRVQVSNRYAGVRAALAGADQFTIDSAGDYLGPLPLTLTLRRQPTARISLRLQVEGPACDFRTVAGWVWYDEGSCHFQFNDSGHTNNLLLPVGPLTVGLRGSDCVMRFQSLQIDGDGEYLLKYQPPPVVHFQWLRQAPAGGTPVRWPRIHSLQNVRGDELQRARNSSVPNTFYLAPELAGSPITLTFESDNRVQTLTFNLATHDNQLIALSVPPPASPSPPAATAMAGR